MDYTRLRSKRKRLWTLWRVGVLETALLVFSALLPGVCQATCGDLPLLKDWGKGQKPHTGFYYNCQFHYGVTIPQGFVGMSVAPPAPQHGFGIVDSRYPSGVIWVSGDYMSFDDITSADDLADLYLKWTEEEGRILSVHKLPVTLDGLPSLRLTSKMQCPDGRIFVDDHVLTLKSGIMYSIELFVEASKYAEHVQLLEQLIDNWQFRGAWCEKFCGNSYPLSSPEKWMSSGSSRPQYTGEYANCYYGYTVAIPEGLTGKSTYPTHVIEGFGALLPHQGFLRVEGGPNRFDWPSLEQVSKIFTTWITTAAHRVIDVKHTSVMLGGLPAFRLIAKYECPIGTLMVKDLFFAFRDEHTMYRVELLTEEEHYEQNKPFLDQIVNSFQLTEVLHKECQGE